MSCCPNCGSEIASQRIGLTLQQRKLLDFIRKRMSGQVERWT